MLNITKGRLKQPVKLVIYGPEGIGKSTLAAACPDPLFIDTEGGTAHMDVSRLAGLDTWQKLKHGLSEIAGRTELCKTLVIDTADWAEQLCMDYIVGKNKKTGIEDFGYGKGYVYVAEEFAKLLALLDSVILGGMNVVVTAHAKMRKFEQPDEMGAYDRWEMKLSKQTAPLLKEWCDALLFCNYETHVIVTDDKTGRGKGRGGRRVIHTVHHPCWDAKNRFGLPDKLELSYASIAGIFAVQEQRESAPIPATGAPEQTIVGLAEAEIHQELLERMQKAGIAAGELQLLIANKKLFTFETAIEDYPEDFIRDWIYVYWDQIVNAIVNDPDRVPFLV